MYWLNQERMSDAHALLVKSTNQFLQCIYHIRIFYSTATILTGLFKRAQRRDYS